MGQVAACVRIHLPHEHSVARHRKMWCAVVLRILPDSKVQQIHGSLTPVTTSTWGLAYRVKPQPTNIAKAFFYLFGLIQIVRSSGAREVKMGLVQMVWQDRCALGLRSYPTGIK